MNTKPFYKKHLFFCVNQKSAGKTCCADKSAKALAEYAKSKLIELNLHGADKVRVTQSGCLGRCKLGPGLVVYPDNVWYRYHDEKDIDKIIEQHVKNNTIVAELLMP